MEDFDPKQDHLFDDFGKINVYNKDIINLGAGCPGPDLLEPLTEMMNKAVQHRMEKEKHNNNFLFQYGPMMGWWDMREALSHFLTKQYGDNVKREELILTCGATHGMHLLITTLLAPNGVIFVEEYTYMIALNTFKEFPNIKIVQVPIKSDGVDVIQLRKAFIEAKPKFDPELYEEKPCWAMFYTIPNFHNPTGIIFSTEICKSLVKLAREFDVLIVCDDVYNMLYYGNDPHPPARLFSYDKPEFDGYKGGHVISNGTFSKILAPGLRVGWMEVPQRLVTKFKQSGIMQSGGSVNNVMFGIVQSFIDLGMAAKQLDLYKSTNKNRLNTFCDILEANLPIGCKFIKPVGGYFIWIELPVNADDFMSWCSTRGGPGAIPDSRFNLYPNDPIHVKRSAIRLTYSFHTEEILREAAKDLCLKLKKYMEDVH